MKRSIVSLILLLSVSIVVVFAFQFRADNDDDLDIYCRGCPGSKVGKRQNNVAPRVGDDFGRGDTAIVDGTIYPVDSLRLGPTKIRRERP